MTHYAGLVRALGRRLRQAQADSGMSQVAVTRKLRWSPSKTSRILSGDRMPSWVDMNALLRVYGADENLIEEMTDLWDIAENSEPKYAAFHHILTPNEIEYYEAIGDADEVLIYAGRTFPIFLRTPMYHLNASPVRNDEDEFEPLLDQLWITHDPKRLTIVIEETAFWAFNTPGFTEQLDKVLAAHESGIQFRILGRATPFLRGLQQEFAILSWKDDPEATLAMVTWIHKPIDWVRTPETIADMRRDFYELLEYCAPAYVLPEVIERARANPQGFYTLLPQRTEPGDTVLVQDGVETAVESVLGQAEDAQGPRDAAS